MSEVVVPVQDVRFPTSKKDCQALLRKLGFRGSLKIDSWTDVEISADKGEARAYIYALTGPVLQEDGEMRRAAKTYRFRFTTEEVRVTDLDGWVVEKPQ